MERPTCQLGRSGVCCSLRCVWKEFRRCGVVMFLLKTLPSHARIRSGGSCALQAHVSVECAVAPPWRSQCEVSDTRAGPSTLPCMRVFTTWSDAQRSGCRSMRSHCDGCSRHSRKNMVLSAPLLKLLLSCSARGCSRPEPQEWPWRSVGGVQEIAEIGALQFRRCGVVEMLCAARL